MSDEVISKGDKLDRAYKVDISGNNVPATEEIFYLGAYDLFSFVFALISTLFCEIIAGLIFLFATKTPRKAIKSLVIANLISLPLVWFVFPLLLSGMSAIISSEIFAVVFEAWFIFAINKKIISFRKSLILSVIANTISFSAGYLNYFILLR
jgi:hypothetical protein